MIVRAFQVHVRLIRQQFQELLLEPCEIDPDIQVEYREDLIVLSPQREVG